MKKVKISEIKKNPENPRFIKNDKFKKLVQSVKDFPKMLELRPIVVNPEMVILGGNMRYEACKEAGLEEVWIKIADKLTQEEEKEFIIKDNSSFGEWDWDVLANDWNSQELENWGLDIPDLYTQEQESFNPLKDTFTVPPFSVLDTKQKYWIDRKKMWHSIIQDKGETRQLTLSGEGNMMSDINSGVSILDPVLAEIANHWFGLDNCNTFDCFAGDSVFGFVSDSLGNKFTGIELRKEQVVLNNKRLQNTKSKYICDDGQNVSKHIQNNTQDLLFSCPPYFDIEVYSNLENDASNQKEYKDFIKILDNAFTASIECLKNNRFAFIVTGDVRNKKGAYYNFPNDVKSIFFKNNMILYNEMVLVESLGTLPQRVRRFMNKRKIGKCHQNILVFYKGETEQIKHIYKNLNIETDES